MLIAEASVSGTPLVGQTLREARLRDRFRLNVAGVWERGAFEVGLPATRLTETSVLFLAGPREALAAYDGSPQGRGESSRCNVLAIVRDGKTIASPSAHEVLEAGSDLILIGDHRGEETFFKTYRD